MDCSDSNPATATYARYEAGPRAVALGRECGRPIFLDLKLHDIPATVEGAVARASALGAHMITVHASGGPATLRR